MIRMAVKNLGQVCSFETAAVTAFKAGKVGKLEKLLPLI